MFNPILLAVLLCLFLIAVVIWQFLRYQKLQNNRQAIQTKLDIQQAQWNTQASDLQIAKDNLSHKTEGYNSLARENSRLIERLDQQAREIKKIDSLSKHLEETLHEKMAQLVIAKQKQTADEQRSDHVKSIEATLKPLKETLDASKKEMQSFKQNLGEKNASLETYIQNLSKQTQALGAESDKLSKALRGDKKLQGDWGEVQLKRLLEISGMKEGKHYRSQPSFPSDDGSTMRPDIIVDLDENRSTIIDAKITLNSFSDYQNAETPEARAQFKKAFLTHMKQHVNDLSGKHYPDIPALKPDTLDFTVLFIPIEAAYYTLCDLESSKLFEEAWNKKVCIAGPSTLFALLSIIQRTWRLRKQEKSFQEYTDLAEKLYRSMVATLEDFQNLGKRLEATGIAYKSMHDRLASQHGRTDNPIATADKLKALGVPTKKEIPEDVRISRNPTALLSDLNPIHSKQESHDLF